MAETKTTTLGVADWQIASFDSGVKDVSPIRSAHAGGTEVPQGKVEEVEKAAKEAGIKLRKL